jgi:Outer membrane protein beta-barrel domain
LKINKIKVADMKKITTILLAVLLSCLFIQNTKAQSIDLGIGGGLTFVQSPTSYTDLTGFSSEFHVGIKGKLNFPLIPITPIGFIDYHFLNGTESTSLGDFNTKQNILTLGLGGELSLVPGPLSPYVGLDFEFNKLGDYTVTGPLGESKIGSVSRTGLGIDAGVMIKLIPLFNVDVSLKYQMLNLFGKESGEETIGIINLNAALFF